MLFKITKNRKTKDENDKNKRYEKKKSERTFEYLYLR